MLHYLVPFNQYYRPSLSLIFFGLKSFSLDIKIAIPTLFWSIVAWYIFFHYFIFDLSVSFALKCLLLAYCWLLFCFLISFCFWLLFNCEFHLFTFSVIFTILRLEYGHMNTISRVPARFLTSNSSTTRTGPLKLIPTSTSKGKKKLFIALSLEFGTSGICFCRSNFLG